ncbi:hypothetical protein ACQPYE_28785 [Actinosynnema sp. CA-299493]
MFIELCLILRELFGDVDSADRLDGVIDDELPALVERRARVCWTRAAEDLDAVHLTVPGLLTAQHVPITTPHGTAILTGWDAESTAWLHLPPDFEMTRAKP